jgi:hypothetical protein
MLRRRLTTAAGSLMPLIWKIMLNLPHPLELIWIVWLLLLPGQLAYLLRKNPDAHRIPKSGELVSFAEIKAVGCVGGFILLTFVFAYCTFITLRLAGIIR